MAPVTRAPRSPATTSRRRRGRSRSATQVVVRGSRPPHPVQVHGRIVPMACLKREPAGELRPIVAGALNTIRSSAATCPLGPSVPSRPCLRAAISKRIDRRAIADSIPLFLPAIPFGFVLGLAATEGEMPVAIGWSTSPLIFWRGGSAGRADSGRNGLDLGGDRRRPRDQHAPRHVQRGWPRSSDANLAGCVGSVRSC